MAKHIISLTILIFWAVLEISASASDYPTVKTSLGEFNGQYKTSYKNRKYEAYEGVPYALPPTGQRRFQPPQPITTPSKEVIWANHDPPRCIQYDYQNKQIFGQEDCLYLNIYTPNLEKKSQLPVILWFHEGAFQRGSGSYTKAKYLMDRDVILVTMNYRLGLFGFLSTQDEVVSGNMGLKDQTMALRWINQNIKYFGGDPDKVSLFGVSAGGSSVHFHYLSKMSAGLFRNGISFSGTALSPWAYESKPLQNAQRLAAIAGCPTDDNTKMVGCLRDIPANDLANATKQFLKQLTNLYFYYPLFIPTAEQKVSDYFINRSPEEILESKDINNVPWVSGIVSEEGGSTLSGVSSKPDAFDYLDKHWDDLTRYTLMYNNTMPPYMHKPVAKFTRRYYVGHDEPFTNDTRTIFKLLYMKTHAAFSVVLEKSVRLQARTSNQVYAYYYSYRATQSHTEILSGSTRDFGVCHLDDILLVLENRYINPTVSEQDKKMLEVMLNFWMSIVNTGKPDVGIEWPPVDANSEEFKFMHINGPDRFVLQSSRNFGQKRFWSSVGFDLHY